MSYKYALVECSCQSVGSKEQLGLAQDPLAWALAGPGRDLSPPGVETLS